MTFVQLTSDERAELRRVSRQALGRIVLRAHMVLLSDRSFSVPQIAQIFDSADTGAAEILAMLTSAAFVF